MPGYRNLGIDDAADQFGTLFTAFDLHHFRPRLFHKARRVADGLVDVSLVRAKRHVPHQQRMLNSPMRGAGVVQHFVQRDRQSVLIAQHGLGQRVTDQHDVDAGLVDQARGRIVVRSQAGNRLVMEFLSRRDATVIFGRGSPIGTRLTISSSAPPRLGG